MGTAAVCVSYRCLRAERESKPRTVVSILQKFEMLPNHYSILVANADIKE